MKDRIKEIRKTLDLTQQEFANRLSISRNNIASYETGKSNMGDAVISLICREFNVREEWLRNGTGEMFLDFKEDEFVKAAALLSDDAFVRSIIIEYWKLNDDNKKLLQDFIHKISDSMREQE